MSFWLKPEMILVIKFIENLLRDTKGEGDILTYNKSFEVLRLKEIAEVFPKYKKEIEERINRVKDLMIPFQKKYYYTHKMQGSYSIKYVLPALIPELSYKNLQINEGGLASVAFESLYYETDLMRIADIRKNLLEYCKMDTFAMVKVIRKIRITLKEIMMKKLLLVLTCIFLISNIFAQTENIKVMTYNIRCGYCEDSRVLIIGAKENIWLLT